jgi:hypothetical protein
MSQSTDETAERHPRFSEMNLVWVDMEMSGLNPDSDRVLEIAVVVTDAQLDLIAEGPVLVLRQSETVLAGMDNWNTSTHARSGLTDKVRASASTRKPAQRQAARISDAAGAARKVADVWQLDLPGPAFHGALVAAPRGVLPLSQCRRQHVQGTGAPLATGDLPVIRQEEPARSAGRHLRVDR